MEKGAPGHLGGEAGWRAACEPEFSPPFDIVEPPALATPLVLSSPHSGRVYPVRFLGAAALDGWTLRRSEDAYVDELFSAGCDVGAPMLRAHFPRAYLDVNREPYELDAKLFDEPLPNFANTRSLRVAAGLGTIPRVVADAREIYRRPLTVQDALHRIESLYKPYHAALRGLMDRARAQFGVGVLIDCHSMPSSGARDHTIASRGDRRRVDFVIGDRYGASAASAVVEGIEERLRAKGYHVTRNRPYAGGYITEHYGKPAAGWHAVQIETSRSLYMDESTLEKSERFETVRRDLGEVIAALAQDIGNGDALRDAGERQAAAE